MNKDCFTPKVLEADCDNTPITFLTTEIEGVDDVVNPPLNGAYKNTIVKYLETGHIYLYNSVGIPTLMNEGKVDDELSLDSTSPVQNKVITKALNDEREARIDTDNALQQSITDETTARENADDTLQNAITAETTARENADDTLQNAITAETTAREEAISGVDAMLDTKVDKENGKGLSTNDYTDTDRGIVDGLETKLNQELVNSIQISSTTSTDVLVLEDGKVNPWTGSTQTQEVPLPVASSTSAGVLNSATYNAISKNSTDITNILQGTVAINNLPETPTQEELTEQWKTASGQTDLLNGARIYDIANTRNWTYYSNVSLWEPLAAGGESVSVNQWTNVAPGIIKGSEEEGQLFAEADGTGSVNGWDAVKSGVANNASAITTINTNVSNNTTAISTLNGNVSNLKNTVADKADLVQTVRGTSTVAAPSQKAIHDTFWEKDGSITIPTNPTGYYNTPGLGIGASTTPGSSYVYIGSDAIGLTRSVSIGSGAGDGIDNTLTDVVNLGAGSRATRVGEVNVGTTNNTGFNGTNKRIIGGVHDGKLDTDAATVGQVKAVSQNVYSTTEKKIGTWIDGKSLYRKTMNFTNLTANTAHQINHNIKNVDRIWIDMGDSFFYLNVEPNKTLPVSLINEGASYNKANIVNARVDRTVAQLWWGGYLASSGNGSFVLTFKYTKTTD